MTTEKLILDTTPATRFYYDTSIDFIQSYIRKNKVDVKESRVLSNPQVLIDFEVVDRLERGNLREFQSSILIIWSQKYFFNNRLYFMFSDYGSTTVPQEE